MKNSVQKLQHQKLTCVHCGQPYHTPRELAGHIRSQQADTRPHAIEVALDQDHRPATRGRGALQIEKLPCFPEAKGEFVIGWSAIHRPARIGNDLAFFKSTLLP
jgi:hypothetical protein